MTALIYLKRLLTGQDETAWQEAQLVQKAQQGNREAFDALFRTLAPQLKGYLARRVGPSAAEDVLNETLLACWIGLPGFSRRTRFKSWLYRIAIGKSIDFLRTQSRTYRETPLEDLEDKAGRLDPGYASIEMQQMVFSVLSQLSREHQEIIELYYYAGLTLSEVALAQGRNLSTVKSQFYRAHALMARALDPAFEMERSGSVKPRRVGVPQR